MADSDKLIGIFPETGQPTLLPRIEFTGKDNKKVSLQIEDNNDLHFVNASGNSLLRITTSGLIVASGGDSVKWNEAYSWGDHSASGYALDSTVVKTTGDQTISGTKTFNNNGSFLSVGNNGISISTDTNKDITIEAGNSGGNGQLTLGNNGDDNIVQIFGGRVDFGGYIQIGSSGSNYNVGVGTSTPSAKLDVDGDILSEEINIVSSVSGATLLNIEGTNGNLFSVVDSTSGSLMSVNDITGLPAFEVFSDHSIVAGRFNTNDFVISSGGNVGIGTATPSGKLHIVGNSYFTDKIYGGSGNAFIQFNVAGQNRIDIGSDAASSSMLIGTTALYLNSSQLYANATLSFPKNGTAISTATQKDSHQIRLYNSMWNGSAELQTDSMIQSIASTSVNTRSRLAFLTSNEDGTNNKVERLSIVTDGNVGIGTTSPSTKLHISASGTTEIRLQNTDSGTGYGGMYYTTAGAGGNLFIKNGTSGAGYGAIYITANNNVEFNGAGGDVFITKTNSKFGVGVSSPQAKIHVISVNNGDELLRLQSTNATTAGATRQLRVIGYSGSIDCQVRDNAGSVSTWAYLRLNPDGGYVGINTGNNYPTTALDVSGVITATGGNSNNWNTAYGWGDHASAGYLSATGGTITNNLTIGGNLTVNGDTVVANVSSMEIEDPILTLGLASGNIITDDSYDRGIAMVTNNGTAFMGWDNSADKFVLLSSGVATNGSGNYDAGAYGDLILNRVYGSGNSYIQFNPNSFDFSGTFQSNNPGGTVFNIRGGGNSDTQILRVSAAEANEDISSNTNSDYGFNIRYRGDLTGLENALQIDADNQTGTSIEALRIKQNGIVYFNLSPYIGSNVISSLSSPTVNYVTKISDTNGTLVNSQIYDNGTNVGIGTTSAGTILSLQRSDATSYAGTHNSISNNGIDIYNNQSSVTDAFAGISFRVAGSGYTNVGTGSINLVNTGDGDGDLTFVTRNNGTSSEKLRIRYDGKVGIGTDTPQALLHVNGQAYLQALALTGGTADRILATDTNKNVVYLNTATYPSLTELSYVKGVTSAIQTQLGNKANTNQTMFIGTTSVAINRTSAAQTLTGVSIDGNAGTVTSGVYTNRSITINGTTNQITSSAGAQDLSANRTWTLSLPQDIHSSATPTFGGLTINGTSNTRAAASVTAATQIAIFNADPASTTRALVTRTPAQLLSDIGAYAATNPNGYTSNAGTVTSVAALTIGTTGTDITSTVANGTTTPVITLNIPTASASNRGALSSTDWSTFNNKVAYGDYSQSNPVFGQKGIKHSIVDNVLYSAADRFEFYIDNVLQSSNSLFNLGYDQVAVTFLPNATKILRLVFNTKGNFANGITHPEGSVYLSFYYTATPASVSGRVKDKDGVWRNITNWTNVAINALSYAVWRGTVPNNVYLVEMELTVVGGSVAIIGADATWLSQIEYVMDRPGQFELGVLNKAQDTTLWRNINFKNNSNTTTLSLTSTGNINLTSSTASRILSTDGSKNITALDTATYPSLTELSYVKGVTSSVQTQLDSKAAGSGTTGKIPKWSSASALTDSIITENSSVLEIAGSIRGMADNTYFSFDASSNGVGITKKGGFFSKFTYSSNAEFAIAQSDSTTISPTGTFTDRFLISSNGTIRFPGLTSNGFLKTGSSNGTLSVDTTSYQPSSTALTTSTNFGGDVSGTYNNIVVADDSHNHIIGNVDGLESALEGKLSTTLKGTSNGLAELDSTGKVPSSQLPSYVDDVLEYADLASFPTSGEEGKIYIAWDTNKTYRWSGTGYIEISASLALGETSSTAYRGDRGKTAYDHSQVTTGTIHGSSTVGTALFRISNNSTSIKFIRVNADNTLTYRTGSEVLSDIGAYAATNPNGYTTNTGTVTSVGGTGSVAGLTLTGTVTTTGNLTLGGTLSTPVSTINDSTTVGQNLVKLTNPSAVRFLRINANNTVDALTDSQFRTAIGAGTSSTTGTVTSVGLSLPDIFNVSGSPISSNGTLSAGFVTQASNTVFAGPSSGNGTPSFRALVAADIPTLNQNTTGSAATLTNPRTLWGQSFNGSANVTGNMSNVGKIEQSWGDQRIGIFFNNDYRNGIAVFGNSRLTTIFSTTNDATGGAITFNTRVGAGSSDTDYGTERMRITNDGKVGIGTTDPGNFRLRVPYSGGNYAPVEFNGPGTGAWGIGLVIRTTGGNDGAAILFRNRDTKNWQIRGETSGTGFQITEDGGDANYGSSFGTPRVHISAGGNVGIGVTDPDEKLEVNGNIHLAANGTLYFGVAGTNTKLIDDNGSNRTVLTARGDTFDIINAAGNAFSATLRTGYIAGGSAAGHALVLKSTTGVGTTDYISLAVGNNGGTEGIRIINNGNVGIGTTTPSYKLQVNGSFGATTKSFRIDHPSRPNYTLEYGSLESPYHGVRLTGRGKVVKGSGTVLLPSYLKDLIHDDETINIQITNIKHGKTIYVDEIDLNNDRFTVKADKCKTLGDLEFFWTFTGTRKDVDKLVVEAEK